MTVRAITLDNGVDDAQDVRMTLSALAAPSGAIESRSGVIPGGGTSPLSLTTVSAMVAAIRPGRAYIDGTASSAQSGYWFINDAAFNVTFADGEPSVARIDRVAAVVFDNLYDSSGSTLPNIVYVKGQASGLANAIPANGLLLYEQTVPAGASAGGGGINFATAVDKRVYTTAVGGIIPVASASALSAITNPYDTMMAVAKDTHTLFEFQSSVWVPVGGNIRHGTVAITPSAANTPTAAAVTWPTLAGSNFDAVVSINSGFPGSIITGVGFTGLTASGMNVILTATNTTSRTVSYIVVGT